MLHDFALYKFMIDIDNVSEMATSNVWHINYLVFSDDVLDLVVSQKREQL